MSSEHTLRAISKGTLLRREISGWRTVHSERTVISVEER